MNGEVLMQEPDGFESFMIERADALMRYGYVLTGNRHDAADLVQEALTRLRGAWDRVRDRDNPEKFVRITMSRLNINRWRSRRREHLVRAVPDMAMDDPRLVRIDDDTGVFAVLHTLPPKQRTVLILRYYEGLSDGQIAEHLGIARGTVRSQALRGLQKLRLLITAPDEPIRTNVTSITAGPRRNSA
jgi:RNA polymerase sigma-70 factor (sigma-E family)